MQKSIFLDSEGDAWFERNHQVIENHPIDSHDPIVSALTQINVLGVDKTEKKILEIGCGEGKRLSWLSNNFSLVCHGIDPSSKAVKLAKSRGILAVQGTADMLPYENGIFDVVVFGFCLYLCDREDLFRIACECDRVLKPNAWVIIKDFFSPIPVRRSYHHREGIYSYKMDYRKLFDWHPAYVCYSHQLSHHKDSGFTDDPQEWVALSIIRKQVTP
jgi:ubiquinone/menaquinone biosynthesis C-methylase UbiE